MSNTEVFGPVELSTRLRNFLLYTTAFYERDGGDVCLKDAVHLMKSITVNEANDALKGYDGFEPVDKDGLKALREELAKLVCEWTKAYELDLLLEINGTGLKTHMSLSEIEIDCGFEIEGVSGGSGVTKQWKRVANPINDQIVVKVTYAFDGTEGSTRAMPGTTIVRPHFGGPRRDGHVGSEIPTPQELAARTQCEKDMFAAMDSISDRVESSIEDVVHLTYSAYKSDDRGVPIDNLDEVAIEGKAILFCSGDFTEEGCGDYESDVVENPTWLELCKLFNDMIVRTNDYHHIFFEGVRKTKREKEGVPVYEFCTGS